MTEASSRLTTALADRYRIERELGAGGMATVYLAQDLKHDRKVAVKVLRPELAAVIGAERFLSEIKTTANLQHPHILPLFDSGSADSFLFYVMPYIEGISLRDRLNREKQLPIHEAVRIAREIASALDYAHRHGVIHRDIKPENILLHDGSALVADFGIALAASKAGTRMTETGMSLGTPQYMSPEQAMGERELDARSDVYALGCVTYEMLTGEAPFSGPTAQAIVAKVMTAEPAAATALRKTIPPYVADAVHTALQKLPADRFASAAEFAEALGNPSGNQGGRGPRHLASRPGPRGLRPAMVMLIAAGALLAGALGTAFFRKNGGPPRVTSRVLIQLPAAQGLRATFYPSIAVPPDGSGVVYLGPGVNTRIQFWLRHWDRMQAERLNQTVDEGCCPTFSPTGDSIAYLSAPRQLNILPLTGGLPTTLPDSGLASVTDLGGGLDWAADGWLYASGKAGLIRINPRNGAEEVIAQLDTVRGDMSFLWPQVLPGGKAALVTVVHRQSPGDPERASIGIADFGSMRVEVILQCLRAIYAPTGHLIVVKSNGVLWAIPFDPGTLRTSGTPRELEDTVAIRRGNAAPGAVDLALDRTGTLTYVSGGEGSFEAVWVDRSGASRPFGDGTTGAIMDGVVLSPDGRRLAVAIAGDDRNLHLWVQPADGGSRIRLTFEGSVNMRPRWRPHTNSISFIADHGNPGRLGLHLFERDAGGQGDIRPLALGDLRAIGGQTWSPDGQWLIFRTDDQDPGNGDIMAVRPGVDTIARALVATPAEELAPAISPDGRWLAYSSNESGRREVYVRPFPETDRARYQVSAEGGMSPVWNPNGKELLYVDAAQHMVSVTLVGRESFQAGPTRVLFSTSDYQTNPYQPQFDLSRDGQRFVMIRRETGTNLGLVVVTNFLEELRRRMAAQ
jgi:Tol biopolymer transport system component/tRNA A-37 threonylcarbamoyl transferase component Bud32